MEIYSSIAAGVEVAIATDADTGRCQPVGPLQRLVEFFDAAKQRRRREDVALFLTDALQRCQTTDPEHALQAPEVLAARRFCKGAAARALSPQIMGPLQEQLLASKLGVTVDNLRASPGFAAFAQQNRLERYLARHGHTLKVDGADGAISILCAGAYRPWQEAHQYLEDLKTLFTGAADYPSLPWYYGDQGLQVKDMYQWDSVEPFMFDDPHKWGDRFVFELCTTCDANPRLVQDHTFIRLRTPSQPDDSAIPGGAVYSFGLYRPGKTKISEHLDRPFRTKPGYIMSPDVSEYWDCEIQSIPIAIDEATFKAMIQAIERSNDDSASLSFHILGANCTLWAFMIAAVADIHIPTGENALKALLPDDVLELLQQLCDKAPASVQHFCELLCGIVVNILVALLGAAMVDKSLEDDEKRAPRPHIGSLQDLLDPAKARLHHPHTLGMRRRKEIEQWRRRKAEALNEQLQCLEGSLAALTAEQAEEHEELCVLIQQLRDKVDSLPWCLPKKYRAATPQSPRRDTATN